MAAEISLVLVRHAIAAERGEAFPDDTKRPLTHKGVQRFRDAVQGLAAIDESVELVLTSPLVRARQTADLLSEGLPSHPRVVETASLCPGASFRALIDELANHTKRSRIALVGHEPGIGEVAARLIGARGSMPFRKGGMCRIDVDALPPAAHGRLVWFATPRMLRKMG